VLQTTQVNAEQKGWIGERYDADAGLQYLNARYYDPELGVFLQPDWFEVTASGVGTNRYSYAFNDPVNLRDSGGNCVWDACVGEFFVAAAIVSSILAVDAAQDISNGGVVGDSVLGNPLGVAAQATIEAIGSDDTGIVSDTLLTDESGPTVGDDALGGAVVESRRFPAADKGRIIEEGTNENGEVLCAYCGEVTRPETGYPNSLELDHRNPHSKGGPSTAENGATACRTCNRAKGAQTEEEYRKSIEDEERSESDENEQRQEE
jgi:RHS repeat-associated protein